MQLQIGPVLIINITNIATLSESLAEKSGVPNLNISVRAMMMDVTPLGI